MEDNYERREDLNPCDNCKWNLYSDKCITCKHYKRRQRPFYPNTTPYTTPGIKPGINPNITTPPMRH